MPGAADEVEAVAALPIVEPPDDVPDEDGGAGRGEVPAGAGALEDASEGGGVEEAAVFATLVASGDGFGSGLPACFGAGVAWLPPAPVPRTVNTASGNVHWPGKLQLLALQTW